MKSLRFSLAALGTVSIVSMAWFALRSSKSEALVSHPISPELAKARGARKLIDQHFEVEPSKAEAGYRQFVAENENSASPEIQDEVGNARVRLGYLAAKKKDFARARAAFQEAEKKYAGTGVMGADFGGLKDQAAYQAAVCLSAEGKKDAAKKAYIAFLKDYQLSPLVHAVHRRLVDIDPSEIESYDAMLQAATTAQEKHIRFEMSVCGPKAIAYILQQMHLPSKDYKDLAKICGTTDAGTTMEGLKKGLKACGLRGVGYEVNRDDLVKLACPAILLMGDHYVVLKSISETDAIVYDSLRGGDVRMPLPEEDDIEFSIPVLAVGIDSSPAAPSELNMEVRR